MWKHAPTFFFLFPTYNHGFSPLNPNSECPSFHSHALLIWLIKCCFDHFLSIIFLEIIHFICINPGGSWFFFFFLNFISWCTIKTTKRNIYNYWAIHFLVQGLTSIQDCQKHSIQDSTSFCIYLLVWVSDHLDHPEDWRIDEFHEWIT